MNTSGVLQDPQSSKVTASFRNIEIHSLASIRSCPWRIEVGDPNPGARTLFLHVFEIGAESDRQPVNVKFVAPAGIEIGERWRVQFNTAGPLGGKVGDRALATTVHTEAQYSAEAR